MRIGECDWRRGAVLVCLAALVSVMAGCPSPPDAAKADAGDDAARGDAGVEQQDTGRPPSVLEKEALRTMEPEMWLRGSETVVPEAIVVEFPREIRRPNDQLGSDTEVSIEPGLKGEWRALGDDALIFEPERSFTPGTSYEIAVSALDVRLYNEARAVVEETVIRPESPWQMTFDAPAFEFVELLTPVAKVPNDAISVDMRFTAQPKTPQVGEWASWKLGGETFTDVTYERGSRSNVIRATFNGVDFDEFGIGTDLQIELDLASGVPFSDEIQAPSTKATKKVAFGEPVDILEVVVREGADGFFVHVMCDDDQVAEQTNFYNVHDQYEYEEDFRDISVRCVADLGSARRAIEFDPSVDISIAPAEAGFQIHGDFDRGKYNMQIKPGLKTVDGGVVDELHSESFKIGPRSPMTNLLGTGRYIPPEAWQRLAYRHRNIDKVRVKVRRVPRENLIFWLSGYDSDADRRTSNLVGKEEFQVSGEPDETETSFVDLSKVVDERTQGVYEVRLEGLQKEDGEDQWDVVESDVSRLSLTDVNIVAKRHAEGPEDAWSRTVDIWTVDMKTAQPLSGAEVKAVRPSGYVLGTCTTTGGHCELDIQPKQLDPVGPFALVASWRDQVSFLEYDDLQTQVPGPANLGGEPYLSERTYRMSLYGDRDLYRPAETVHVTGVLRTEQLGPVEAGVPVKLKLYDSRGNEAKVDVVKTNEVGAVEFRYELGDLAETGQWRMEATIGKRNVASHEFFVEEFVPERMRVKVNPGESHVVAGDSARFDVSAEYLFGASAEGSQVNTTCSMTPQSYTPEGYDEYTFGAARFERDDSESTELDQVTAEIGEDGKASVSCDTTELTGATSARLSAQVSVMEAGSGRTTNERASTWVHPASQTVGLKTDVDEVEQGETFTVDGVVTNWKGEKQSRVGEVDVEFVALDYMYSYYYRHRYGHRSRSDMREMVVAEKSVDVSDGTFSMDVPVNHDSDLYAVRVRHGGTWTTLTVDVDSWSYWHYGRDDTPEPQMPNEVVMEVDGPAEVDRPTKVSFQSPFKGRALLTVETHQVLKHEWKSVDPGENSWTFSLDEFSPNVYVTAFVVKDPMVSGEGAFTPRRAYGVRSVKVKPKQFQGSVEIDAPEKVRPSSQFEVDVSGSLGDGPAYATVAVVDQGILQLTEYETPNPLDDLLAKRRLSVDTFDTIGWNIRTPQLTEPVGGGGAGSAQKKKDLKGRTMPVEPVAMWSGVVKLENGRATVPFEMPHFRGEVRIMAAAYSKSRVAMDDQRMKVRDPLGLQTTTPRFLTAGDTARVPVMVTNQTGSEKTIKLEVSSRPVKMPGVRIPGERFGMLNFRNTRTRSVTVSNGESARVAFPTYVVGRSGAAILRVDATTEGYESYTESTIPIQPATPMETKTVSEQLQPGEMDLTQYLDGWVPRSERTTIRVTAIPFADVLNQLDYLIRYPYGCLEQTTSSVRPLLYMSELANSIDPSLIEQHNDIDTMVERGIERVWSMQTSSGGFTYWPGSYHSPEPWETAYTVDMLLDAKEQGHRVTESRLESALDWMDDYINSHRKSVSNPYMHYVLARADRGDRAEIRSAISHWKPEKNDSGELEQLSGYERENLYLLKAALYLAGDRQYASELKDLSNLYEAAGEMDEDHWWHTTPNYYSPMRRLGLALAIHQNLFGTTEQTQEYVTGLVQQMRAQGHLNTQEAMWGVTALGKWVEGRDFTDSELGGATLRIEGEEVEPSHRVEGEEISWSVAHAADRDSLTLTADVSDSSKWFVVLKSRGVREEPTVKFGDHGLEVRREYLNAKGELIELDQVELGDVIYVRDTISNPSEDRIENIAMVDRLPAGLEVENPRLSGSPEIHEQLVNDESYSGSPSYDGHWWYDHMNVRDDRVQVFGDISGYEDRQVVYAARATIPGTFKMPTVEAHAMYAPTLVSRQKGREITIRQP